MVLCGPLCNTAPRQKWGTPKRDPCCDNPPHGLGKYSEASGAPVIECSSAQDLLGFPHKYKGSVFGGVPEGMLAIDRNPWFLELPPLYSPGRFVHSITPWDSMELLNILITFIISLRVLETFCVSCSHGTWAKPF